MSSSLVDSATALRLAAFLPPAETNTWGKKSAAIYVRLSNERTCLLFGRSGYSTPATSQRALIRFFLHFRLLGWLRERARRCCERAVRRTHASIAIWPGGATSRPRALLRIYVSTQLRVTARRCGERSQWRGAHVLAPVLVWENNSSVRIFNLRRETRNSSVAQITA